MVEAYQSGEEIGFTVPGSLLQQVKAWEEAIDERIFHEQLLTGRLVWGEGEIYPHTLESMKKRYKKHGEIEPYYGCSGAPPTFDFQILPELTHLKLTVKHGAIDDTFEFASLPLSQGLNLPEVRKFRIKGIEWENLLQWEEWDTDAALSDRYIFHFFSCSIGGGATVKNAETGNEVNVTDYDDW